MSIKSTNIFAAVLVSGVSLLALTAADSGPAAPTLDPKLQERLTAEKDARKACKAEICKALAAGTVENGLIACDATKTWLDTEIGDRILLGKISWPLGHAKCTTHIEIDRSDLVKLASSPEATVKLKPHTIKCVVDKKGGQENEKDAYTLKISLAPEVTFKNGKASSVKLNWSDIDAPTLLQGAIWSATTLDSAFNIMSGSAVAQIDDFMFQHCKEVGVEIKTHS